MTWKSILEPNAKIYLNLLDLRFSCGEESWLSTIKTINRYSYLSIHLSPHLSTLLSLYDLSIYLLTYLIEIWVCSLGSFYLCSTKTGLGGVLSAVSFVQVNKKDFKFQIIIIYSEALESDMFDVIKYVFYHSVF